MSKPSMWVAYTIERNGNWPPSVHVARFLNDPENFKDYEVISVSVVQVTDHSVEILVRQRALR